MEDRVVNIVGQRPIKSVTSMSKSRFWQHTKMNNEPFVIRGGISSWNCMEKWTFDYLSCSFSDTRVTLAKSREGVFDYNENSETSKVSELENVPFPEAVNDLLACNDGERYSYIQQHDVRDMFPSLLEDIERPEWLDPSKIMHDINIWLGSSGCFSPLHYDLSDNFLVQVRGRKNITLFDKQDSGYLYPNIGMELDHCSKINLLDPDYDRYPLLAKAQAYYALLEPGDVIYIPRKWWHAVHSLDPSISVNYWWGGVFDALRDGGQMFFSSSGRKEIMDFFIDKRPSPK